MALPLPSPMRDYAPVTWDTQRISEVITELNALNTTVAANTSAIAGKVDSASHVNQDGHPGIYQPSALQYYLETNNGNGASVVQTVPTATFRKLDVAGTVATNNGGGFSSSTDIYTVPAGGIYVAQALVRVTDGFGTATSVGIGWHTSEIDGYWFQWNKYVTGAGNRCSLDYTRIASWSAGNQLRLYMYQDSTFNMDITAINLSVWRIG